LPGIAGALSISRLRVRIDVSKVFTTCCQVHNFLRPISFPARRDATIWRRSGWATHRFLAIPRFL